MSKITLLKCSNCKDWRATNNNKCLLCDCGATLSIPDNGFKKSETVDQAIIVDGDYLVSVLGVSVYNFSEEIVDKLREAGIKGAEAGLKMKEILHNKLEAL